MEALKSKKQTDNQISEVEVIARIIQGEKELFEILIRRTNQKLYRVIRSYIKDDAEIEDIIQNTHLRAYEKLYQFRSDSSYSTWLIKIGINQALAQINKSKKFYRLNDLTQDFESNTMLEMPDKNQISPENKIIQEEATRLLESAIDSLDLKYRTVYILREVEGMSIKEISSCLSISASNVKVRIHRAKLILKEKLFNLTKNKNVFEFGFSRCDRITDNVMNQIK